MALTDTPTQGERYNTQRSLLALNSSEENPQMGYRVPLSDDAKAELEKQKRAEEGEDERAWYDPLDQFPAYGAGLLAAGA